MSCGSVGSWFSYPSTQPGSDPFADALFDCAQCEPLYDHTPDGLVELLTECG